jgi:hypothetical protein
MKRLIAEWIWRATLIGAIVWIGWELHQLRAELNEPTTDEPAMTADAGDLHDSLDEIRDSLADLTEKVDAIRVAIAHSR